MTGNFEGGKTYWFVVAPVKLDGISIAAEDSKGNVYRKSSLSEIQMTQGMYRNLGKLDFEKMREITVSAEHVYGTSNMLNGTKMSVALPHTDITGINLTVTKKDNNAIVRTITNINDVVNGIAISDYDASANCPYLPCGEYYMTGSYTTESGTFDATMLFTIDTQPEDLNVTSVTAFTSYTKYNPNDANAVAEANKCDGTSIYIEQIGGISENIYNNGNYADCFKAKFNGSETQITASYHSEVGKNRFSMPAYGKYTSAVVTFDGVSSSAVSIDDCHVTGIPYNINTAVNDGWVTSGFVSWNKDGAVRLGYNLESWSAADQASITKSFYAPSDINVSLLCTGTANGGRVLSKFSTDFSILVANEEWYKLNSGNNSSKDIECNVSDVLPKGNPEVKCHNSKSTNNACSKITSFSIYYDVLQN
jgi:hypothetical protein